MTDLNHRSNAMAERKNHHILSRQSDGVELLTQLTGSTLLSCPALNKGNALLLKLLLVAQVGAVLMLAGGNAVADDATTAESSVTAKVEALEKTLGLSDEQIVKAQPIFTDNIQQRKSVMSSYGLGNNDGAFNKLSFNKKRQLSKQMGAINSATDKQLKLILSSEQMKQYQSIREANKEKTLDKMKAGS
jgi:hypothetical protein